MNNMRSASIDRKTTETDIAIQFNIDGSGNSDISTGIPFFDHMLTLFTVHGFFDMTLNATGDIDVDYHHTVEDVGIVIGDALNQSLGKRNKIARYGEAATPMDDALCSVVIDLSRRPFLCFNVQKPMDRGGNFDLGLTKEFFRAFSNRALMNLHINMIYGENEHHIIESIFKCVARSLDRACAFDNRIEGVRSSKGAL